MVMDLLGPSLEDCLCVCDQQKFGLKTVRSGNPSILTSLTSIAIECKWWPVEFSKKSHSGSGSYSFKAYLRGHCGLLYRHSCVM